MATSSNKRRAAHVWGQHAESMGSVALMARGYRILARRWRCRVGEIDIIARHGNVIAFVEVKARHDYVSAAISITERQQQRIMRAAEAFMQNHPELNALDMRFDAILIEPWCWPVHVRDAWRA